MEERGSESDKRRGRAKEEEEQEKKFSFFFTFVILGGWMYCKSILGYSLVIITF